MLAVAIVQYLPCTKTGILNQHCNFLSPNKNPKAWTKYFNMKIWVNSNCYLISLFPVLFYHTHEYVAIDWSIFLLYVYEYVYYEYFQPSYFIKTTITMCWAYKVCYRILSWWITLHRTQNTVNSLYSLMI